MSVAVEKEENAKQYYKGYYIMTSRCNLSCSYCVLENAAHQLKSELDLKGKMDLISHLYHVLDFRKLTLSGGEAILIGKHPPFEFKAFLRFLRDFRFKDPDKNLKLTLNTNALYLDEQLADEMVGIIDQVAITIDSNKDDTLSIIGRNRKSKMGYYANALKVCKILSDRGISIKLHSVISSINYEKIGGETKAIYNDLASQNIPISKWKFFQYMSYDDVERDRFHNVKKEQYDAVVEQISRNLEGSPINLHFKGNEEMNSSLFNILAYGNAQYMLPGGSWSTTKKTGDLRGYKSMTDLFVSNSISPSLFNKFHAI